MAIKKLLENNDEVVQSIDLHQPSIWGGKHDNMSEAESNRTGLHRILFLVR